MKIHTVLYGNIDGDCLVMGLYKSRKKAFAFVEREIQTLTEEVEIVRTREQVQIWDSAGEIVEWYEVAPPKSVIE